MRIVIDLDGREREVDVILDDPHATVADLAAAAVDTAVGDLGLEVDSRWFPPDHGLDEVNLHEGAVVRFTPTPPRTTPPPHGPPLAVVEGPCAGRTFLLDGRSASVGRSHQCDVTIADPTVSEWHAELEPGPDRAWVLRDLGSQNGTWLDGQPVVGDAIAAPGATIRLGATHLRLRDEVPDDRPLGVDPLHRAVGGRVPFNRPPRPGLPGPPGAVDLPARPESTSRTRALSVVAIVAPIVLGIALVVMYRNPRFALFLLLSPVMAIGNWLSSRRQTKKETRSNTRTFRQALERLDHDLDEVAAHEVARREVLLPDLAEVTRRIETPSSRLWQRRPVHDDFLRLRVGLGDVPWDPPTEAPRQGVDDDVGAVVARASRLPRCPVEVDLSRGGVVGLVGDRSSALDLARALVCQAAAHHGPADVGVAIITDQVRRRDWDWAKWLPHTREAAGDGRLLAAGREQAEALLHALLAAAETVGGRPGLRRDEREGGRTLLVVVDDVQVTQGRRAPARLVLRGDAGPVAGIVVAETVDQLPAVTTTVVHLHGPLGDADLRRPADGFAVGDLVIGGLDDAHARRLARHLARYEDPELEVAGAALPRTVRLLPVLGMDDIDADRVQQAWRRGLPDPSPSTPIGVGEDGVVGLDLVTDGPHGLVGGTTGSGKSELLRSLVAGMAARTDPDHLTFVLVDYKGGSAFDHCARLPHTVGLVTDLDEHLGERALRSLEAELHHREKVLRDAGAQDLPAYLAAGAPQGPLPRLVVVIDEFATLAAELPDFLGALVGIAQRGRSLGVHLILATQRPSGAVNANIKANTNLRVALRVQDTSDSTDIIDRPDAADIPRSVPGRAYIRLGPSDVLAVQTALSTATPDGDQPTPVQLMPFGFEPVPPTPSRQGDPDAATDLQRLVEAARAAFDRSGARAPRRPWLPPLPDRIHLDDVLAAAGTRSREGDGASPADSRAGAPPLGGDVEVVVPLGVADDPDHQRQVPVGWDPAEGHLALFGMVGSGTTTGLRTVAAALLERYGPDGCHVHAVDLGAGGLASLTGFPHVGTVVPATAAELRERLLRMLRRELDRRRDLDAVVLAEQPLLVVLVDGIGALLAEFESGEGMALGDAFRRVFSDGPTVRIVFAVTGDRVGELPMRYGSLVARRLLLRHADPQEFSMVGLRPKQLPSFVPGRAVDGESGRVVQLADPGEMSARAAQARTRHAAARAPVTLRTLPTEVGRTDLPQASLRAGTWRLPVALAEEDLGPVVLELHPGDHALVTGPPRSGTTSTLMLLAEQVRAADPDAVVVGVCRDRSPLYGFEPLDGAGSLADLAGVVKAAVDDPRRWVVLVDDAASVADAGGVLAGLLAANRDGVHVVAAGRPDDLRSGFSHWTRDVRRSRTGILLAPNLLSDGELLGVSLPRRVAVSLTTPGRGFVVAGGVATLAQVAAPDGTRDAASA